MIIRNIDQTERLVFFQMREDYIRVNHQTETSDGPFYDIFYPIQETRLNRTKFWIVDGYMEDEQYFDTLDECILYIFKKFNEYLQRIQYFTKI